MVERLRGHSCQAGDNEARDPVPGASEGGNEARERS